MSRLAGSAPMLPSLNTGIFASQDVLAGLLVQTRTDRGQKVEVSMLGSLLHLRGIIWTARSNPDDWFGFHLDSYTNPPETGYATADDRSTSDCGGGPARTSTG